MDWTIEKSVELGVNAIYPLFSQRCQVKLEGDRKDKKHSHWNKIIAAACAQSQRIKLPMLHDAQKISNWLRDKQATTDHPEIKIILHPDPNLKNGLGQLDDFFSTLARNAPGFDSRWS